MENTANFKQQCRVVTKDHVFLAAVRELLKQAEPGERLSIISNFCWHCGSFDPHHTCMCGVKAVIKKSNC